MPVLGHRGDSKLACREMSVICPPRNGEGTGPVSVERQPLWSCLSARLRSRLVQCDRIAFAGSKILSSFVNDGSARKDSRC